MSIFVPIISFGSILFFLALFAFLPKRRALLISFIGAWLFLPVIPDKAYDIENLPEVSKLFVTCAGILLAVIIFDFKRLRSFRPAWLDLPMLIWCLAPIASSVSNCLVEGAQLAACFNPFAVTTAPSLGYDLGLYDGLSEAFAQTIQWGIPYLLGRLYITDLEGIKELGLGIIYAVIAYTPFLLYEMRMSPQLHRLVYGYHQHLFHQTFRFGGWRPMVFMNHGLMLALWVMAGTVLSFWMWRAGSISHLKMPKGALPAIAFVTGILAVVAGAGILPDEANNVPAAVNPIIIAAGIGIIVSSVAAALWLWRTKSLTQMVDLPFWGVVAGFFLLVILMRSVNGWVWTLTGVLALIATDRLRTRWIVIALLIMVPLYAFANTLSLWPTELSVDFMTGLLGPERAQSLEFRYFNESYLTEKARQQWLFGWAGWDRQLVTFEWTTNKTVPDSMWIIVLGKYGLIGLISLILAMLTPTFLLLKKFPPWLWAHPTVAPLAALSIVVALYMLDGLLNTMINPVYMLGAGGLLSAYYTMPQSQTDRLDAPILHPAPATTVRA